MNTGNDNLVSQGVQAWIGFEGLKYLFWELIIIAVVGSVLMHRFWHFDYFASGAATFVVSLIFLVFRKLAMIFTVVMSLVWAAVAGFIAWAFYTGGHFHHPFSWVGVIVAALIVFMVSCGMHLFAIGFIRTATR